MNVFVEKDKVLAYILPDLFVFCESKVGKLHLFRARFMDSGRRYVQNVTMRRFRTVSIAPIESKNQVNPLKIRLSMTIFRNQPGTRFNKLLHNLYSTATATCLFLLYWKCHIQLFSEPYSLNACVYFIEIWHTHSYWYSLPGERVRYQYSVCNAKFLCLFQWKWT